MSNNEETKGKVLFGILISILIIGGNFLYKQCQKPNVEKQIEIAVKDLNSRTPYMMDSGIRVDEIKFTPPRTITFRFVLVGLEEKYFDFDKQQADIIEHIKTNPQMKDMREARVYLSYIYADKNGSLLKKIDITPEMYK